jgi:hypothetical protein
MDSIASMIRSPNHFNPLRHFDAAGCGAMRCCFAMLQDGYISKEASMMS